MKYSVERGLWGSARVFSVEYAGASILAQPPLCLFHGQAWVDGAPVPGGTRVSAWVEGVKVAETTTADDGSYRLVVMQPDGKKFSGSTVVFKLGVSTARQTGV